MTYLDPVTFPLPVAYEPHEGRLDDPARKDHQHIIRTEDRKFFNLLNGWTDANSFYLLDPSGFVHIEGRINAGTVAAATVVAVLPEGYRPPNDIRNLVLTANGTVVGTILISSASGNIALGSMGPIATNVYFQSVFLADPEKVTVERL